MSRRGLTDEDGVDGPFERRIRYTPTGTRAVVCSECSQPFEIALGVASRPRVTCSPTCAAARAMRLRRDRR